MIKRLDDLQVLRLQSHDSAATENPYFKSRRASDLVALLAALQHTVLAERLQTVFKHLPADDAFPLRKGYRGLRAGGLFERCTRSVQGEAADEGVEEEDCGEEEAGFDEVVIHGVWLRTE